MLGTGTMGISLLSKVGFSFLFGLKDFYIFHTSVRIPIGVLQIIILQAEVAALES